MSTSFMHMELNFLRACSNAVVILEQHTTFLFGVSVFTSIHV